MLSVSTVNSNVYHIIVDQAPLVLLCAPYLHPFVHFSARNFKSLLRDCSRGLIYYLKQNIAHS